MKRFIVSVFCVLVLGYVGAAGGMYFLQRDLIFKPGGSLETPEETGLPDVDEVLVKMPDGASLLTWQAEPRHDGLPTVLYFHGQGGNISDRASRYQQILDDGYGLMAVSYRGYPGSDGLPSEDDFIRDGTVLFDLLNDAGKPVIVHGESLGTGVAAAVGAARSEALMVVLEAPYTAAVDIAAQQYPWLPVRLLMKDPFITRERINEINAPVFIVHGTEDRVIPVGNGEALYELAQGPKRLLILEGATHGNLWSRGLWPAVVKAVADASGSGL
ncbi:hypothetical protein JM93_02157 [Roseibium hamelinense]|uniref:Serine aminopeptidase S33 domain-containing protein n=1 Tax=Roseibium hamelinense TaxID=150831 RepID=A0A562T3S0_9HYPH|nr:lysophospholipase [Roseibium hamelinense]MTI43390.1 alpha/beta hydrolase [Roseibium hamelinense]TWI87590.1 hypothetical protein JM93_02157 [Roseibium hamelinense]